MEEKMKMLDRMQKKVNCVKELSAIIPKYVSNVLGMTYEVYEYEDQRSQREFVIINYVGGGYSVRDCTGNSCSAIVEEIATKLNSGYYEDIQWYEGVKNNKKYTRII